MPLTRKVGRDNKGRLYTTACPAETDDNFSDVSPYAYYAEAVAIAKKLGIARGIGNNRFSPKEKISRQDMVTLIYRAMEAAGQDLIPGTEADLLNLITERILLIMLCKV